MWHYNTIFNDPGCHKQEFYTQEARGACTYRCAAFICNYMLWSASIARNGTQPNAISAFIARNTYTVKKWE